MTPEEIQTRLAEITAREQAATPGPWCGPPDSDEPCTAPLDHEGCKVWPWDREDDMKFAYAARLDVPFLLKLVGTLMQK